MWTILLTVNVGPQIVQIQIVRLHYILIGHSKFSKIHYNIRSIFG